MIRTKLDQSCNLTLVFLCYPFSNSNNVQVVPPTQARKIYEALKEKGLPVALIEFEGEQHGFRKVHFTYLASQFGILVHQRNYMLNLESFAQAENIKFTLEQQMLFFARLVGRFEVAD